jgi:YD repeat-containing protein
MRNPLRSSRAIVAAFGAIIGATQSVGAQQPTSNPGNTQRLQGTRNMHVACVGPDSGRTFTRAVGDSLTRSSVPGVQPIVGGTQRSHEYPEYDVVLDVPNLCVERIFLKVDSVTAKIALDARVANLLHVSAGADVLIGDVDLTIQDVRARALLLVDLDDVVHAVDQTLTFVDNHPEVVTALTSTLQNTGAAVGGVVGNVVGAVQGLLLGTTKLADGNMLQHVVDQATGNLVDKTLSAAGKVIAQKTVGSILNLPVVKETKNAAGNAVRQVRDQAGNLIEFTLDKANKLSGVRLIK